MTNQPDTENKPAEMSSAHTPENSKATTNNVNQPEANSHQPGSPGILSIFQSVLAAMFGVQSEEKRMQDFETGNAASYIFVGVVMVVIFIFTLIAIVNTILEDAGMS